MCCPDLRKTISRYRNLYPNPTYYSIPSDRGYPGVHSQTANGGRQHSGLAALNLPEAHRMELPVAEVYISLSTSPSAPSGYWKGGS